MRLMTYRPFPLQSSSSSLVHTASYWKSFHLKNPTKNISSSSWQVRIRKPVTIVMELSPSLSRVSGHGGWITCQSSPPWHPWKAQQAFLSRAGRHRDFQATVFHQNNVQSKITCAFRWKYFQINKQRSGILWKPVQYHFWQITAIVMKSKHLSHRVMRSTLMHTGSKTTEPQLKTESLLYLIRHMS